MQFIFLLAAVLCSRSEQKFSNILDSIKILNIVLFLWNTRNFEDGTTLSFVEPIKQNICILEALITKERRTFPDRKTGSKVFDNYISLSSDLESSPFGQYPSMETCAENLALQIIKKLEFDINWINHFRERDPELLRKALEDLIKFGEIYDIPLFQNFTNINEIKLIYENLLLRLEK